jgi:prephenate dehydratase
VDISRIDRTIAALLAERERLGQSSAPAEDAAYQGVPGAFSEDAAMALLGAGARLYPCDTLETVFTAVLAGRARAAVVPIENTLAGAVPGCVDLLAAHPVHIVAEHVQPIVHALIAPPGVASADVRRVLSHPVALAQCERFFRERPEIQPVPVFDTAGAVAEVIRQAAPDAAAIAGRRAAEVYGGVVLADGIQDRRDNATRFLLLEPGAAPTVCPPGGKTSLYFVLANQPGALLRAIAPFASRGLNLSRIESRPLRDRPFEYAFFVDVGPTEDPRRLGEALREAATAAAKLRVLGHYRAAPAS